MTNCTTTTPLPDTSPTRRPRRIDICPRFLRNRILIKVGFAIAGILVVACACHNKQYSADPPNELSRVFGQHALAGVSNRVARCAIILEAYFQNRKQWPASAQDLKDFGRAEMGQAVSQDVDIFKNAKFVVKEVNELRIITSNEIWTCLLGPVTTTNSSSGATSVGSVEVRVQKMGPSQSGEIGSSP